MGPFVTKKFKNHGIFCQVLTADKTNSYDVNFSVIFITVPRPTNTLLELMYRTHAIITRGLYTFCPLFEVHLFTVTFGLMYG